MIVIICQLIKVPFRCRFSFLKHLSRKNAFGLTLRMMKNDATKDDECHLPKAQNSEIDNVSIKKGALRE